MKKYMTAILLLASAIFLCEAGEYSGLLEARKEEEKKIGRIDEEISGIRPPDPTLWYWFTNSWWTRRNAGRKREEKLKELNEAKEGHRKELAEINRKIEDIEKNTVVTVTRFELRGVPVFDEVGAGNADLRIYFRTLGPKRPIVASDNIGHDTDISYRVLLRKGDDIVIKDEDVTDFEDMGAVSCADIFSHAWNNDHSKGIFEKQIYTKQGFYTIRIHYDKKRQGSD